LIRIDGQDFDVFLFRLGQSPGLMQRQCLHQQRSHFGQFCGLRRGHGKITLRGALACCLMSLRPGSQEENVKITRVEPILIAVPYEHGGPKPMRPLGPWTHMETLFVRVDTDAGLIGWGEAFGFAASPLTREALRVVAPLCVRREVSDVPSFMTDLRRKLHAMGRHGPVRFALAGIDIALWDLVGKAQGVPLHRLLGGASRERIPTYASLLRFGNPDLVARFTQEAVGRGYTALKLHEHLVETVSRSWSIPTAPGRR